jgi:hypothetical protein
MVTQAEEGEELTFVGNPRFTKHDVPLGIIPWLCTWSRGVGSSCLVLVCTGKT